MMKPFGQLSRHLHLGCLTANYDNDTTSMSICWFSSDFYFLLLLWNGKLYCPCITELLLSTAPTARNTHAVTVHMPPLELLDAARHERLTNEKLAATSVWSVSRKIQSMTRRIHLSVQLEISIDSMEQELYCPCTTELLLCHRDNQGRICRHRPIWPSRWSS